MSAFGVAFGGGGAAAGGVVETNGTFTPTLICRTTDFDSVTYEQQAGLYRRIGDVVHCYINLRTASITVGSASGALAIGGLPFAASEGIPNVGWATAWGTRAPVGGYLFPSGTITLATMTGTAGATTTMDSTDVSTGAGGNEIFLDIVFLATD